MVMDLLDDRLGVFQAFFYTDRELRLLVEESWGSCLSCACVFVVGVAVISRDS